MLLLALVLAVSVSAAEDNIGYFWHISDFHLDPYYWEKDGNCRRGRRSEPGQYGEHYCDSPWSLLQSAVQAMSEEHGDNLEFVLFTGDGVSDTVKSEEERLETLRNVTELLGRGFRSEFVFPVLGHAEPRSLKQLGQLWRHWLPTEAINTFDTGGYYTIEMKSRKLKVLVLNTNLWLEDSGDPGKQWEWLEKELDNAHRKQQTVYLVGHIAPGCDERQGAPPRQTLAEPHNSHYIDLVTRHADIITGQFFGHLHSDTFRLLYRADGEPVSTIFLAPSLTPRRTSSGANNPALRLYRIDSKTGQVLDFTQYYLDLETANHEGEDLWTIEYNFTRYYGLAEVSPLELHDLVQSFTSVEGTHLFDRYWLANSVQSYDLSTNAASTTAHYCAITQVDFRQYQRCLDKRTSALAASHAAVSRDTGSAFQPTPGPLVVVAALLASVAFTAAR